MSEINEMIDRLTERQRSEFALACARRVQHLMRDPRSIAALDTRERWLRGEATDAEMAAAWDAAWAASAAGAASAAEWAAGAAAAASAAEWAAAWAAAAAARDTAGDAAWDAEAAARDSAATAWAAAAAARDTAGDAAWDAERAWQRAELERMLKEAADAK